MHTFKSIIALILSFAILSSAFVVPSFAAEDDSMSFWEWAACATSPAYAFYKWAMGADPEKEDDTWHFGGMSRGGGAGRRGYSERQKEMPVNGYSSGGGLLWYTTFNDLWAHHASSETGVKYYRIPNWFSSSNYDIAENQFPTYQISARTTYYVGGGGRYIGVTVSNGTPSFQVRPRVENMKFQVPFAGTYTCLPYRATSCSITTDSGAEYHETFYGEETSHHSSGYFCYAFEVSAPETYNPCYQVTGAMYFPVYRVVPDDTVDTSTIYNINTRIQTNIFNETTNVYTNPTTGEQKTVNNWNFDYTTRTYDLHFLDGMTVKLEFGDINIKLGETTVNDNVSLPR